MLTSSPTKRGFGITLYGDYEDLGSIHKTIHKLCDSWLIAENEQNEDALSIAYEIRKAYEGKRETIVFKETKNTYFSFNIDWPFIIFYTSYFRYSASYCDTNKEDQSNLYRLEYYVEKSLIEYDHKIGNEILSWYQTIGCVSKDFIISYVDDVAYEFLYGGGSGKMNFRRLPQLLRRFIEWSDKYKEYSQYMQEQASINNCTIAQLFDSRERPEIKW